MKKNLCICLFLLVVAALLSRPGEQPVQSGFSIHGVGLGWPDEQIEAFLGPEMPSSACPPTGSHLHHYSDGLVVMLDSLSFQARTLEGRQLELDGVVLVTEGDSVDSIQQPFRQTIQLENGALLVAQPGETYFGETPAFGWRESRHKGGQIFQISYRYLSDDGRITDSHDFDLDILAKFGRVERVRLRWMGH